MPAAEYELYARTGPANVSVRSTLTPESGTVASAREKPQQESFLPMNIHHDPRVARGNTFAGDRRAEGPPALTGAQKAGRRARKSLRRSLSRGSASSLFEKPPSRLFLREEIDLTRYLNEPGENFVRLALEVDTQTDEFKERPLTPDFVPKKTGVDACTQIELSDELFDWDEEVQPLLAVLVGKTLEQARIEVEREYELEGIRQAAKKLNQERAAEALRVAELKRTAVLAEREKEELRQRRRTEAEAKRIVKGKVACLQLTRQALPRSLEGALADLSRKAWTTPTLHQIKSVFLPWVFEDIAANVQSWHVANKTLDTLLETVDEIAEMTWTERIEARRRGEEERELYARAAEERLINFYVPAQLVGVEEGDRLGPVEVRGRDTVDAAEAKVLRWLRQEGGLEEVVGPPGGFFSEYLRLARRIQSKYEFAKASPIWCIQEVVGVCDEVVLAMTSDA